MSIDIVVDDVLVLFEECVVGNGMCIGIVMFNVLCMFNGFLLLMVYLLLVQLNVWVDDDGIVMVVLQGVGEKVFCVGGDLYSLYKVMVVFCEVGCSDICENVYVVEFFDVEYCVDYFIYIYVKLILCWGYGIVMGGGIGLMFGVSYCVVSECFKLVFLEIIVGLFFDVGGSWLLLCVLGKGGLFLVLIGVLFNLGDVIYVGLVDVYVFEECCSVVFDVLLQVVWFSDFVYNYECLIYLLQLYVSDVVIGLLLVNVVQVDVLCEGDDFEVIVVCIVGLQIDDVWLQVVQKIFVVGVLGLVWLVYELQCCSVGQDLVVIYCLEYIVVLYCVVYGDFVEGICVLLIDKDCNLQWNLVILVEVICVWFDIFFVFFWVDVVYLLVDLGIFFVERSFV